MRKKLIILFLILFIQLLNAQNTNPLAKFGNQKITIDEFKYRFELSPRAGGSADAVKQKEQFLYTLISDKLWALEAKSLGMENDEYLRNYLNIIEKMYLRDALFNDEIQNKADVANEEILKDLKKIDSELELNFLYSADKNEINSLYKKLKSGFSFNTLLAGRPEEAEQRKKITVVYGQVEEQKENILFSLNEGECSHPVKENTGWVIYYLKSKSHSPLTLQMDVDKKIKSIKEVIENRKRKVLFEDFVKQVYGEQVINVDKDLFKKLLESITNEILLKCERINCNKNEKLILYEPDFYKVKKLFTDYELNSSFIKFEKNPANLNYFIDDLSFKEFKIESVENNIIEQTLSGYIREFITLELLAHEGYKKNYKNSDELENAINMWSNNYLSQSLKNKYIDSARVTDAEAYKYFLQSKNDSTNFSRIKIIELLTGDLQVVENVLNQISSGVDFKQLAIQYSRRENTKANNCEIELGYLNNYPELKEAASNLNIGEFGGPIKLDEGYSIFQLIEKEEIKNVLADTFAVEKENIKQRLFYEKMEKFLKKETIELAKKYNLEINEDLLKQVKTTEINALVYRHFGFGGRILAAPFLNMFYKWFEEYQKEINEPL